MRDCVTRKPMTITLQWKSTLKIAIIGLWETLVGDYKVSFFRFQLCILDLNFNGSLIWD